MSELSALIKNMLQAIAEAQNPLDAAHTLLSLVASDTRANGLLCQTNGTILCQHTKSKHIAHTAFAPHLQHVTEPALNLLLRSASGEPLFAVVQPLVVAREHTGFLFLYRPTLFLDQELEVAQMGALVCSQWVYQYQQTQAAQKGTQANSVKASLATLSYTELDAATEIFAALTGLEGIVNASRIALTAHVTRSAIVNALRKLESAGLIEARSLGVKGTHIKVHNPALVVELGKFQKMK